MTMILKALLIVTLLISSHAVQLRRQGLSPIEKLQKLGEQSGFQKNLVNSVLLDLSSGGAVDDVIAFLDQAISDTQTDFNNLVAEAEAENLRLESLVSGLTSDVEDMNTDLSSTILEIHALATDIETLDSVIENSEAEISSLDDREVRIRTARDNDNLAFANRQLRDTQAISALQTIIPELQNLANQASTGEVLLEKPTDKIMVELAKITNNNALSALIQVSTTFNAAKLAVVVTKLSTILDALIASKAQDEAQQEASENRFNGLITQLEELRVSKTQALITARGQRNAKDSEHTLAEAKRDQLQTDITSTSALLESTVETQTVTTNSYNRRTNDARAAIQGLQDARQIIVDGAESLRAKETYTDSILSGSD